MKLSRSAAHLQRPLPQLALIAALARLEARLVRQLKLKLEGK